MRILQLTPGTGSFLCGSCMRDNTLVRALRREGHDALIVPLYLPFALEAEGLAEDRGDPAPVRMGGINVYLRQIAPWTRRLPGFLTRVLDSARLLKLAAGRSRMTDPTSLGPMTLSVLSGDEGRQAQEVERLAAWIDTLEHPDVIVLSNAMLIGLARRLREVVDCPVICTLQGEAPFLDALEAPYDERCWSELRSRAKDVDGFVAVSEFTRGLMTERLDLDPERVHVVHNGIDLDGFEPASSAPERPTIGYLARLCADKGLPELVDAFLRVRARGKVPGARLVAGGVRLPADEPLQRELERRVRDAGAEDDVTFRADLTRTEKIELLRSSSVFSVPAGYGESFGLYLLEALACGVPVVQPRVAAFPELVEATGGGVLVDANVESLASGLEELLLDAERGRRLGASGRDAVRERFTSASMARGVADVCTMIAAARSGGPVTT